MDERLRNEAISWPASGLLINCKRKSYLLGNRVTDTHRSVPQLSVTQNKTVALHQ